MKRDMSKQIEEAAKLFNNQTTDQVTTGGCGYYPYWQRPGCPSCGYCQHCGRGGSRTYEIYC